MEQTFRQDLNLQPLASEAKRRLRRVRRRSKGKRPRSVVEDWGSFSCVQGQGAYSDGGH